VCDQNDNASGDGLFVKKYG